MKTWVIELESLSGLQQTALQTCQNQIAGLEETIEQLVMVVKKLEKTICQCHNQLLLPGPHYTLGEEEEMMEVLNGGSAYSPYGVNWILLTSDPMLAALPSDLKIWIPLS